CLRVIACDGEGVSGHEGDALLERDGQQRARAHTARETHPEVEAAVGIVPAHAGPRELALERGPTPLELRAIHVTQLRDVRRSATAAFELEHDALPERSC